MNISLRQQEVTLPVARADSFTVEEQGSLRRDLSPWDWGEDREVSASVLPVSAAQALSRAWHLIQWDPEKEKQE